MTEGERVVFEETAEAYETKMEKLALENKHLKQQLKNKNKKIKELQRVLGKKKKKEQHFRNQTGAKKGVRR